MADDNKPDKDQVIAITLLFLLTKQVVDKLDVVKGLKPEEVDTIVFNQVVKAIGEE